MPKASFPITTRLRQALMAASQVARSRRSLLISPSDLLEGLLSVPGGLAAKIIHPKTDEKISVTMPIENVSTPLVTSSVLAAEARNVILRAAAFSAQAGGVYMGTEHLLLALVECDDQGIKQRLLSLGGEGRQLKRHLKNVMKSATKFAELVGPLAPQAPTQPAKPTKAKHSILEHVGRDLTDLEERKNLDPVIGREVEINRLIHILSRRTKNNPILVGQPGVGKTAIVEGLAAAIADGRVPAPLLEKRVIALDVNALVAGTIYRGEFEARMQALVEEIRSNPDIILFIDELHTIIGAGSGSGSLDAANILKPALARGELHCIGATTLTEYKRIISFDPALNRRFQAVLVEEPSPALTLKLIAGLAPKYEEYHAVRLTPDALEACVRLSGRHISGSFFPDKAIDLLDEACARVAVHGAERTERNFSRELRELETEKERAVRRGDLAAARRAREEAFDLIQLAERAQAMPVAHLETVTVQDVAAVVAERTHVPISTLLVEVQDQKLDLALTLQQEIMGQDHVIEEVARAIRRNRAGLAPATRPVASFLFVGPSGVGKTFLAQTLARTLFGDEKRCIRVDMSECSERFMTSRLIGAPPGYVGYREGGALTEAVKNQPASVVLLDEIEKAHPDIPNLLLQVLDEGRLTDAEGTPVDFRNTVLIMTSNLGQELYAKNGGFGFDTKTDSKSVTHNDLIERESKLLETLREILPHEFLNRFDRILPFRPLTTEDLATIAKMEVTRLAESLASRKVKLELEPSAARLLVKREEVGTQGARAMRRLVTELIADPLSELLLENPKKEGLIKIGTQASKLTFRWVGKKD